MKRPLKEEIRRILHAESVLKESFQFTCQEKLSEELNRLLKHYGFPKYEDMTPDQVNDLVNSLQAEQNG